MKFKAAEDIDAPVELVFERFCDFTQIEAELRGKGAQIARVGGWKTAKSGSAWAGSVKVRGRARQIESTITQIEKDDCLVIESRIGGMETHYELTFRALTPKRARVTATLELKPATLSARLVIQTLKLARGRVLQRLTGYLVRRGDEIEAEHRAKG